MRFDLIPKHRAKLAIEALEADLVEFARMVKAAEAKLRQPVVVQVAEPEEAMPA